MGQKKILYFHVGLSSFVKKDIAILSNTFELKIFHFKLNSKKQLPLSFISQFFFLIGNVFSTKGIVVQFGGYQSYLPTLFGKIFKRKTIIIMGGTDAVSFPSIQYGCFYNKYLNFFTRKSLKRASLLLPVSENLINCDYTYSEDDFKRQGYQFHAPEINTPEKTIYNGYDASKWYIEANKEENSFLTIAADLGTRFGKKLKGIDLILEVAPKFPNCKFYIVGGDKLKEKLPVNVIPVGNMPHDELPKFIANKEYYLQLSMSEGFPNALCEAMLSGCIPIVSNVGAMSTIVSSSGYILMKKNINQLEDLIHLAMKDKNNSSAENSRKRIIENFPLDRRTKELTDAISQHLTL